MQHHDMKDLSVDEIAAELERERAVLAGTIDGLRERLSVDAVLGDAFDYVKANMAPYARALDGAVRANPLAAVMAGVGVAWLVFGRRTAFSGAESPPLAGTKFEALSRWEDEGGPVSPHPDHDDAWMAEADGLRDDASGALARIDAAARGGFRPVAEIARDRAEVLGNLAKATRTAMLRGLESLSSEAQTRVLAIREQAYSARIAAMRQGTRLIEERPVFAGAIGMAIGAAVAAALPQTAMEDRLFGEERDRLLLRAKDALRQERTRAADMAARVADTVASEVKSGARELVTEAL
jgi:ElaB/YqjD/DUF883 family membrane-anchored ribosome-binding protein